MVYQLNMPAEISPAVSPPSVCCTWGIPILMHSGLSAFLVIKGLIHTIRHVSVPLRNVTDE